MAWQAFGTLAAGNQPLSLFDTLAGQIAQTVVVPTNATGTNVIALALTSNAPNVTSYLNYQQFSFVAANASTGLVTVNVNSIGALNLYKPGAIQAGSGDITAGVLYVIAFNQALAAGAGGFQIVSTTPATLSLPVTVPNGGTGLITLTAFALLAGGTTSTGNVQQVSGLGAAGQLLQSQGAGVLPQWATISVTGGTISIQTFTSSQTVTIPANVTRAWVRLVGGGGGGNSAGGAAGAYLEKFLTGLTAGLTLALTIGAGGASNTGGGASSLASGTQTISTLTCNGGAVGSTVVGSVAKGGTASGGDINITGGDGITGFLITCASSSPPIPGITPLGNFNFTPGAAGYNYGTGGNGAASTGAPGVCIIWWLA